jgi:cation diffusion facilitator CzcD-associated flavoprotein CzcO
LIQDYVREAAREQGIDRNIRFQQRVTQASWSTDRARWTLEVKAANAGADAENLRYTCNFLYMCSGYYDYEQGYAPKFTGEDDFTGRIVHPQRWTSDIDYAGKRVVVIGSGATAVTLVPSLAEKAAHVVMLQRSPTYVVSIPGQDVIADYLRAKLPPMAAYRLTRWKNIGLGAVMYQLARRSPEVAKKRIVDGVREALGASFDVDKHFKPSYGVWDQRVCIVPDGDMFAAIRAGRASVVTDEIDRLTPKGIRLRSGQEIEADLIVKATGLDMKLMGGVALTVDGRPHELKQSLSYRGCMFTDIPNLAYSFGYFNASWTLKADLIAQFVCRVLRTMDEKGTSRCLPRRADGVVEEPFVDFSSGYVKRALDRMPRQGDKRPFRVYQNYMKDFFQLRFGPVDDGVLDLSRPSARPPQQAGATHESAQP